MYLDNLTNDYAKMCMSAYCADFESFIKYYDVNKLISVEFEIDEFEYDNFADKHLSFPGDLDIIYMYKTFGEIVDKNKLNKLHILTYILVYTCRHNFIFAYQLRHSELELNEIVYEAISASFIQHGYLEDYFIRIYKPINIWYPKYSSKETCLKLLKIHDFYKYSVAYLSVIMGWDDIFIKCNLKYGFKDLYLLTEFFGRDRIKEILDKFLIILDNVYAPSETFNKYNKFDHHLAFNFLTDFIYYYSNDKILNDDIFVNREYQIYYNILSVNIKHILTFRLDYRIIENNIRLQMGKKLPFNFPNKYVAYIGDIQYYQGGDFEYAKWGALNNSIFANYVINNKDDFPDFVIRNAVSNMLINGVVNNELINKYKPFYLYNFHSPHHNNYYVDLIDKFPFLKPNILFALSNNIIMYNVLDHLIPDIDIIRMILPFYHHHLSLDDLIKQAKEQGYYYKHLDFENECNYDEPKKIPFDSVNLDDLKNQTLAVFQEELSFTDFTPFNH
ncbi:Rf4p protein [Monosporozyma servazzii]